jgi:hypothetical protein
MKAIIVVSFVILFSVNGYSQTTPSEINTKNKESDSILNSIHSFDLEYNKEIEIWSPAHKAWFTKTFVFTRGHFTIPKEPIQPWKEK